MGKKLNIILVTVVSLLIIGIGAYLLRDANFAVLQPKGSIGESQKSLLVFASLLSLVIVVPVFILTFYIVFKYKASNTKAKYSPNWDHSKKLEAIWWGIPILLIAILSVTAWRTSHSLDPFRPLASDKKPLTIQVVALQWRWLFIYPEQNIATTNLAQFPVDTPVNFVITADAPMNSFWIPQLGGQIYAMSGMSTQLHLMANQPGDYDGVSANISGEGFADMRFTAKASTNQDFDTWVAQTKQQPNRLSKAIYDEMAQPSTDTQVLLYSSVDAGLYDTIVMKYMAHPNGHDEGMGH